MDTASPTVYIRKEHMTALTLVRLLNLLVGEIIVNPFLHMILMQSMFEIDVTIKYFVTRVPYCHSHHH